MHWEERGMKVRRSVALFISVGPWGWFICSLSSAALVSASLSYNNHRARRGRWTLSAVSPGRLRSAPEVQHLHLGADIWRDKRRRGEARSPSIILTSRRALKGARVFAWSLLCKEKASHLYDVDRWHPVVVVVVPGELLEERRRRFEKTEGLTGIGQCPSLMSMRMLVCVFSSKKWKE